MKADTWVLKHNTTKGEELHQLWNFISHLCQGDTESFSYLDQDKLRERQFSPLQSNCFGHFHLSTMTFQWELPNVLCPLYLLFQQQFLILFMKDTVTPNTPSFFTRLFPAHYSVIIILYLAAEQESSQEFLNFVSSKFVKATTVIGDYLIHFTWATLGGEHSSKYQYNEK